MEETGQMGIVFCLKRVVLWVCSSLGVLLEIGKGVVRV